MKLRPEIGLLLGVALWGCHSASRPPSRPPAVAPARATVTLPPRHGASTPVRTDAPLPANAPSTPSADTVPAVAIPAAPRVDASATDSDAAEVKAAWAAVAQPSRGPALALGAYARGCLRGGVALAAKGPGFVRMREGKRFGHPALLAVIRDVGAKVASRGWPAMPVADLAQARGGPSPKGHASHQSGLDVDIWYAQRRGQPVGMVDRQAGRVTDAWQAAQRQVLAWFAEDARVARIFVHPRIKQALCLAGEAAWLYKIRPWWGHDDHFHVRLHCPATSEGCEAQASLDAAATGCDELAWWLDAKAQAARDEGQAKYQAKVGASPALPAACAAVLAEP